MNPKVSVLVTRWCSRLCLLTVAVLLFWVPHLVLWYQTSRGLQFSSAAAILIAFYCCAPVVIYALWCIERLTGNILKADVFVLSNVQYLRRLRWCCALVGVICLPAAYFYLPLIFLAIIMLFLALAVSLMKNVMAAAIELREENDLTI